MRRIVRYMPGDRVVGNAQLIGAFDYLQGVRGVILKIEPTTFATLIEWDDLSREIVYLDQVDHLSVLDKLAEAAQ